MYVIQLWRWTRRNTTLAPPVSPAKSRPFTLFGGCSCERFCRRVAARGDRTDGGAEIRAKISQSDGGSWMMDGYERLCVERVFRCFCFVYLSSSTGHDRRGKVLVHTPQNTRTHATHGGCCVGPPFIRALILVERVGTLFELTRRGW